MSVGVADKIRPNFLDHSDQARAAWTSIEPDGERSSVRLVPGSNKNIMYFTTADLRIQISGVDSFVNHALNKLRKYWGDERITGVDGQHNCN